MRTVAITTVLFLVAFACFAAEQDEDIVFADRNWVDKGDVNVGISGTLTGDGVAYRNNTYAIACYKELGNCFISSVEQIGPKHIGRMDYPYYFPIIRWTASEVVALDDPGSIGCVKTTITLSRDSKTALWVREPVNQTSPYCKDADTKIRKWTIENSFAFKKLYGR